MTYDFTINFCDPLEMKFDEKVLTTEFADNDFTPVDVKKAIEITDGRGRGVTIVAAGEVDSDNAWGITDVKYKFELLGNWGAALSLSEDGVLSYTGTGFGYNLPATVQVRVTASVAGISVVTDVADITIKPAKEE